MSEVFKQPPYPHEVVSEAEIRPDYDALRTLKAEVERFKSTNSYNPMHVTNFYVQAGVVIRDYERALSLIASERKEAAKALRIVLERENTLSQEVSELRLSLKEEREKREETEQQSVQMALRCRNDFARKIAAASKRDFIPERYAEDPDIVLSAVETMAARITSLEGALRRTLSELKICLDPEDAFIAEIERILESKS